MLMIIKTIDENKVCASFLVCMLAWLKQYILHIYNQHTEWFRSQSCCVIKTQQWRISWDPEDKITSPFLSEAHVSQPGGPSVFLKSSPKHGPVGAGVGKSKQLKYCHFFFLLDGLMVGRKCMLNIQHIQFGLLRFRSRPGWWWSAQLDHWEKGEMLDQSQSSSLAGTSLELHSCWLRIHILSVYCELEWQWVQF